MKITKPNRLARKDKNASKTYFMLQTFFLKIETYQRN